MKNMSPQILGNNHIIFTEKENALEIKAVMDRAVARFKTAPVNTHQLSCDCYALLPKRFPMDFSTQIPRSPLWEKSVEPVLRLIKTHYMEDLTAEKLCRQLLCIPAIPVPPVCALPGYSRLQIFNKLPRITKAKELLLMHRDPQNSGDRTRCRLHGFRPFLS